MYCSVHPENRTHARQHRNRNGVRRREAHISEEKKDGKVPDEVEPGMGDIQKACTRIADKLHVPDRATYRDGKVKGKC